MTQEEIIILYNNLSKVSGVDGRELTWAIKKNLKNLQPDIEIFQEEEKEISKIIEKFSQEREDLQKKYATVNKQVKTKVVGGVTVYDIPEGKLPELHDKINKLAEKEPHKSDIKKYEEKWAQLMKFRKEKVSLFVPIMVKKSDIPDNISDVNMNLIFDLIEE